MQVLKSFEFKKGNEVEKVFHSYTNELVWCVGVNWTYGEPWSEKVGVLEKQIQWWFSGKNVYKRDFLPFSTKMYLREKVWKENGDVWCMQLYRRAGMRLLGKEEDHDGLWSRSAEFCGLKVENVLCNYANGPAWGCWDWMTLKDYGLTRRSFGRIKLGDDFGKKF